MPLVDTKKMFEMAYKDGHEEVAFDVNNMEITQNIVDAIAKEETPLILQISKGSRQCASLRCKIKNSVEALLVAFYGIPATRAKIGRAEAALKWIEVYEKFWDFLEKIGLSEEDRRSIIVGIMGLRKMKNT